MASHPRAEVVGHRDFGNATKGLPGTDVGTHPAGEVLAPRRFGIEHPRAPEDGYEDVGLVDQPVCGSHQVALSPEKSTNIRSPAA